MKTGDVFLLIFALCPRGGSQPKKCFICYTPRGPMNASHIGCQNQAIKGCALGDSRKTGHHTRVQVLQETLVIWSLTEVELEGTASEVSEEDYSWPFRCVFNKKPAPLARIVKRS